VSGLDDPSYFLSDRNPVANSDQRAIEALGLEVMDLPVVQAARARTTAYWRKALEPDWDRETEAALDAAMVEYAFNYVLKAVCSDASHPRIGQIFLPAHDGFGQPVPGSRIGGDNPDNIYRFIAIEHGAAYELHGRADGIAPSNVIYSLVSNYGTTNTVAAIETPDIELAPDGSFVLTIDAEPAGARRNHLQTQPGTLFLFIRDTLGDWARQTAMRLRIKRLTPPTADPLSAEEIGARAAVAMFDTMPLYYWYQRTHQHPINRLELPKFGTLTGGPLSQVGGACGIRIEPGEAVIVKMRTGGAGYHSFVAHDMTFRTIDAGYRTSSFNPTQAVPDPDGTVTYVVARRDPGVANWVDIADLPRVIVIGRWQLLPPGDFTGGIDMKVVPLPELDRHLPPRALTMTAGDRERQRAERTASSRRRLIA